MSALFTSSSRTDRRDEASRIPTIEVSIKQLARKDRAAAMELLVRTWDARLRAHAWGILKDGAEAHDVVQEVFMRAMREPRMYAEEFRIQAWLYRVTRNLCFNLVRDRRRRETILSAATRSEGYLADPLERVFEEQRQDEVLAAFERLTKDHRTILELRYYQDLSYAEIADKLSLKLGTVMSRLSRARDRLLEVLGDAAGRLTSS